MKVLLIGSGGREHALAWALSASPLLTKLYCAPGNPGIAEAAECVAIPATDHDGLLAFAREKGIDFVVIGPEQPLVDGLWDKLEAAGIKTLGPSKAGAVLEGSKGYVKDLCAENAIPTAAYRRFDAPGPAKDFAATLGLPVVIKADGLAAGKGVVIAQTREEADAAIDAVGGDMVIEEYLDGEEASFFVLSDGEHVVPLGGAQDHKRAFDGDKGPNTGGMGAYSPAPIFDEAVAAKTMDKIVRPTIAAMARRGTPYMGVLFAGLMIKDGEPKLIEYNCRFGDPECQVLMMRLKSDLLTALLAARDRQLAHLDLRWSDDAALTVVMATRGYPGDYAKGSAISGLDAASEHARIFHAGTALKAGHIVANGGRVLAVTATAPTIADAQRRAYEAVDKIDWPEGFCRRDIGYRALKR
ncbi:MAG TPA: phosphoribosylamine--glycine ligase [Rhizomicrobium sp.]|nr:phosphoribosylamine--glycine ligase [Rhizomicrobium sp.]